jgi:small subunit ribosomal protein S20
LAEHKSAKKRAKQNEVKRLRNKAVKTSLKRAIKQTRIAVEENSKENASSALKTAQIMLDKAVKKGVIHKKTGSRTISRISKQVNGISA